MLDQYRRRRASNKTTLGIVFGGYYNDDITLLLSIGVNIDGNFTPLHVWANQINDLFW